MAKQRKQVSYLHGHTCCLFVHTLLPQLLARTPVLSRKITSAVDADVEIP